MSASIAFAKFLGRIDDRTTNAQTPIVLLQSKYLVFAPNFLSGLNVGFGFKRVKKPERVR